MTIPLRQQFAVARYIVGRKLRRIERYPLVLMLEPLFRCNLACAGCGKIDYPDEILSLRLSVDECVQAAEECGAPIVSIAGGEPLVHKEMPAIVRALVARNKFVYLCTNALLLQKKLDDLTPSPYLTLSIHLDGNRERHDASVCQPGVYDRVVDVVRVALERGFRVTVNCTLFQGESAPEVAEFFDYVTALGVEGITVSPGFSYSHAPRQDIFLSRRTTKQLFRDIFAQGRSRRRRWPLNHSSTRPIVAPRGATPRATCSAGRSRVICWWTRATRRASRHSSMRRRGSATAPAGTRSAPTAWPTAATSRRP